MMSQGRVPMAEDLIGQAVIIFKKNANENGLADAYHEYGNLYKHDSYHNKWSNYYKQKGTYDGTYIKSIDNYKKAVELFDRLEDESGVVKCLMGIGNAYSLRGEKDKALEYYKDALGRYNMAKKGGRIKVEPIMNNPNYKNMGELLEAFINEERK
ncbi:MAG: hypothetical protein A2251_08730 [Elusimicrobia bacterium RIFOXYA2_FULL_47_53]|nr:MAG: hypothetical protein A2251_08730 [Elusimicrobia bacterium RIFOXYA2_FULL_47_53]